MPPSAQSGKTPKTKPARQCTARLVALFERLPAVKLKYMVDTYESVIPHLIENAFDLETTRKCKLRWTQAQEIEAMLPLLAMTPGEQLHAIRLAFEEAILRDVLTTRSKRPGQEFYTLLPGPWVGREKDQIKKARAAAEVYGYLVTMEWKDLASILRQVRNDREGRSNVLREMDHGCETGEPGGPDDDGYDGWLSAQDRPQPDRAEVPGLTAQEQVMVDLFKKLSERERAVVIRRISLHLGGYDEHGHANDGGDDCPKQA